MSKGWRVLQEAGTGGRGDVREGLPGQVSDETCWGRETPILIGEVVTRAHASATVY